MKYFFFILLLALSCKSQEKVPRPAIGGGSDSVSPFDSDNPSGIIPFSPNGNSSNDGGDTEPGSAGEADTPTEDFNTLGTGGRKGLFEDRVNNGLQFIANISESNSESQSHGLLVLLHGSSRSSYDRFVNEMAGVAEENGLLPVSVLAPNGQGWNEGGANQLVAAADALHELIQNHFYQQYNIDKRKIFFSGQSSGGGFLSTNFVAAYGHLYQGGAFMQCGMQPPQVNIETSEGFQDRFKMHFEITRNDPIWLSSFAPSVQAYESRGFDVTFDNTKNGGHCQFSQPGVIQDNIGRMLPN